jgi:rubrerythrin
MSLGQRVTSDHQLARLLQIGMVLEEVVEARSLRHAETLDGGPLDDETRTLLEEAAAESADHRAMLETLIDELDVGSVPYEEIETLVEKHYAATSPEDFDGLLYDQLCNEETAYKFYDDLIEAIESSEADFAVDRDRVLETLRAVREEEAEGVEAVTRLMERQQ